MTDPAEMPVDDLISSPEIPDSSSDTTEPQATVEPLPLWRVMQDAAAENPDNPGVPDCGNDDYGLMIEALRDRIVPQEPEPFGVGTDWWEWSQRRAIRALLTREAAIARGEAP